MKDIAIYGLGGLGREIACLIKQINKYTPKWNLLGFFDDGKHIGETCEYGSVLGGITELNNWTESLSVVIAIGTPETVVMIVSKILNENIDFPNIIAPDCKFLDEENITIGKGNVICTGCCISCNVHIGDFNILNGYVTIGHDAKLGSFNSLMPAVRISGYDDIGNRNYFGVSSVVLQNIKISNDIILGANSVLMKDTEEGGTYIGNPARVFFSI
jgi:sugar O-acyltransferase (sialic acid O-acetyltransferase NeuD family)